MSEMGVSVLVEGSEGEGRRLAGGENVEEGFLSDVVGEEGCGDERGCS